MNNEKYIIYVHINKINNKKYVGQTKNPPERRWRKNGKGYKDSPRFYKAIQKYGWENFEHIILEKNLSKEQADTRERYWIKKFQSNCENFGYNLTPGGSNYMSEIWKDSAYREKVHNSFSEAKKRKVLDGSFETDCLKPMLEGIHRAWQNEEWRQARINNLLGDKNPNSKSVRNIETKKEFSTIKEAAAWAGLKSISGIGQCCKGKQKTSGKHHETGQPLHWEYL